MSKTVEKLFIMLEFLVKLFILDSNGIICRYFFAMPEYFTEDGLQINGLFGYCKLIKDIIEKNKKCEIIATFDKCSKNFRKEINPEYKANRKKSDSNLTLQIKLAEDFCREVNIRTLFDLYYEADDIIASVADQCQNLEKYDEIIVISTDKDLMQLVNEKIKILNPFTKTTFDRNSVIEKFGIEPEQINLYLALCGDSSDNIKGIAGVGQKTAVKIIQNSRNPLEMQSKYPKYNFEALEFMLSLTTLKKDFIFDMSENFLINVSDFNNALRKLNLNFTIK